MVYLYFTRVSGYYYLLLFGRACLNKIIELPSIIIKTLIIISLLFYSEHRLMNIIISVQVIYIPTIHV